ncbi:Peptidase family S41 [Robiginitalea myxolifaciens]|uniref:Peptidase family S41 n=1 Tax=Robiginitalea myxolifaciens TaxID=400055 RepID=A0A1I6GYG5_9FLAO|nr:S41 family peptidase [Robiginitalea myxolifaciens]SFR47216.1 Peptidase family S41 [Robiginitalea myxolifaciens]
MKTAVLTCICLLFCLSPVSLKAQTEEEHPALELSAEAWQEDLASLQKTIHTNFPFLLKKISPEEFDAAVSELHDKIPSMQPHEIMVGLARIVASIKYGHTQLAYWEQKVPYHQLPIILYEYEDGIFIQGVHQDNASLAGARVVAVEGVPIMKVKQQMLPVIPAENEQFAKGYGIHYMTFPEFLHAQGVIPELKMSIDLTVEQEGKTFDVSLEAVKAQRFPRQYGMVQPGTDWVDARDTTQTPLYLKNLEKIYFYEYLEEEKVVYVRHSQIQDDPSQNIPQFYAELFDFIENNDVEKLIIDVRLNGGGNNYKNKPIITGLIKSEKINQPGKLMVIIGRRTFSACQNLVNEMDNYTNAIFVGEGTGENINFYGDTRPVELSNSGMKAYLSFAWWQDKPQWENDDALYPQIEAVQTFEDYRTNNDPALEAALKFKDTTYIANPMEYLTGLFMEGKMAEVRSEAARMVRDPNYAYYDFMTAFDTAGNQLLAGGQVMEAGFVIDMTLEMYPEAPELWLTKAGILMKQEKGEEAATWLKKLLESEASSDLKAKAQALLDSQ